MSEDEIIYIDDDNNIEEPEGASSESTGSSFGSLEDNNSVSYNQLNQSLSNNQFGRKQNNNSSNPLSNIAKNALNNKLGNKGNVPESLKKRKNNMPGTKANNNNTEKNNSEKQEENNKSEQTTGLGQSNQNANGKEKGTVEQAADAVAKKGGSAAMQAAGVPKPLADFIANKFLSGKSIKFAIIGGIVAFFMQLIIILGIMYIMFFPILKGLEIIGDLKDGASNFFDSAGNWISGDGWCANEEECTEYAEKKFYEKVEDVSKQYPNLDMSLVLSSVLYGINTTENFEDTTDITDEDINEIESNSSLSEDAKKELYQDAKSRIKKVAKNLNKGKDAYEEYMLNTFIPKHYEFYITGANTKEQILKDIYALASFFNDYKNVTANISSGGVCSYSVNGQDVSNIKVRLRTCSWDPNEQTTPINGELIDFEKYITGVVYAENSGGPMEALKAQAIAARSFALARAKNMGGSYGISLAQENGQWVLDIRNCTADQVYCDPDKGCWTDSNTAGDTVYSGYVEGKAWSKGPLPEDSEIRTAVKSVNGMALIDSSGNIVNAPYTNTEQISWNKKASEGKDYNEILLEQYPNAKSVMSNCSANLTGDWLTWKQYDSRWGSTKMGTSNYTVAKVGCLVTSVSIQIARSGTQINLPSGVTEFNPGTFVANNPGMFSSGTAIYNGGDSWKNSMAPGFVGAGRIDNICGTRQEKVNKISEYINQGYYLVTRVKFDPHGQHWVAIIGTSGNEVQIVDPGWPATELFSYYGVLGANSNCLSTYLYKRID